VSQLQVFELTTHGEEVLFLQAVITQKALVQPTFLDPL
jgi:hypothetical protein